MVLYYTLTRYQQLGAMLHKILFKPMEGAHLYISNGNFIELEYLERLRNSGIFDEVKVFDDQPAWGMGVKVDLIHEELLYEALNDITQLCYRSLLLPIAEYDDIYVFADHFPLGFVLAYKNVPYHYVEEAAGVHCCFELWMKKLLDQNNRFLYMVGQKVGVYGNAECVIDCYVDLDKQDESYSCDKAVDFSVVKLLKTVEEEQMLKLLSIFGIEKKYSIGGDERLALILTEYVSGSKVCSWYEQRCLYGMFIDYLCEGMTVLVKPHPNDHQGIYRRWFPGILEIEKSMPSELLPYCVDRSFDRLISFCSTSYVSLADYTKEVFSYRNKDIRSEKLFRSMNGYYAVAQMIMKIRDEYTVIGIGADALQLKHFFEADGRRDIEVIEHDSADFSEFNGRRIIVIDLLVYAPDVDLRKIHDMVRLANDWDVFIFINTANDVLFYLDDDNEWAEDMVAVHIEEDYKYDDIEKKDWWIFMFSKDIAVKRIFLTTRIDRMLENAGIELKVNCDKSIRERMLEGMLYATERKCCLLTEKR